jgi:hypothetical protein
LCEGDHQTNVITSLWDLRDIESTVLCDEWLKPVFRAAARVISRG